MRIAGSTRQGTPEKHLYVTIRQSDAKPTLGEECVSCWPLNRFAFPFFVAMPLFLMRHGLAELPEDGDDFARRLTPEGQRLAERAAAGMEMAGYFPDRIFTSPYPRARETADAVAQRFGLEAMENGALSLGADPVEIVTLWEANRDAKAPLLVGHQPELEDAVALITGQRVSLPKGALVVITQDKNKPPVFSKMILAETLASFAPPVV